MKKRKFGFSVVDIVLLVLIAACILSSVFRNQIRTFFDQEEAKTVEITFLVENVTQKAKNHPVAEEELLLASTKIPLGKILSVTESKNVYQSTLNPEETVEILTLTCKMTAEATPTENGYTVAGVNLKPGTMLSAETESASFEMVVTMVKNVEVK